MGPPNLGLSLGMGAGKQKATWEVAGGGGALSSQVWLEHLGLVEMQLSFLPALCNGHINLSWSPGPGLQRCPPRETGKGEKQRSLPMSPTKLGSYMSWCWHVGEADGLQQSSIY